MQKKTIRDIDVNGKRVLLRVDYNVPMENKTNLRYSFVDDKDFGDRTLVEQKKIIFLKNSQDVLLVL